MRNELSDAVISRCWQLPVNECPQRGYHQIFAFTVTSLLMLQAIKKECT